jgi:glycerol-3-phosphate dehydrogenase
VPDERARFVFAIPAPDGLIYAGITDEPVEGPVPDVPEAPEADITFLLSALNPALATPIGREDVVGAYAGLRPLLDTGGTDTSDISRRHALFLSRDGVVTIVGGKLTTYRRMAQDAVDAVVRRHGLTVGPCRTKRLPLVGAGTRADLDQLAAPVRLIRRYGMEAPAVATLGNDHARFGTVGYPSLGEPIAQGVAVTGAELLWGLRHEGALTVDDLLDRRCRIGLVPTDRHGALTIAEAVIAEHETGA